MAKSNIIWTDRSTNPTKGCSRKSPGCENCYAARMAYRLEKMGQKKYTGLSYKDNNGTINWTGKIVLDIEAMEKDVERKTPTKFFIDSMSDLFHPQIPFEFILKVYNQMLLNPQHIYQILTKRIVRAVEFHEWILDSGTYERSDLKNNIWIGTTTENQNMADSRIPELLKIKALFGRIKAWISIEPMLEEINLKSSLGGTIWIGGQRGCTGKHYGIGTTECPRELHHHHDERCRPGLDWVVVGGESGPGARPMHPEWVRKIKEQCIEANVPFLFKQWGAWLPVDEDFVKSKMTRYGVPKNIRQTENQSYLKIGKKNAGRLLDGVLHNENPEMK